MKIIYTDELVMVDILKDALEVAEKQGRKIAYIEVTFKELEESNGKYGYRRPDPASFEEQYSGVIYIGKTPVRYKVVDTRTG